MTCIVYNDLIHICRVEALDLWEVSHAESFTGGTTNNVISRMLVRVSSLFASSLNDFEDRVYTEPLMRVRVDTLPADFGLRQILRVYST